MKSVLLSSLVFSFLLCSCSASKVAINKEAITTNQEMISKGVTPPMIHNVYFWYKDGADQTELDNFEKELQKLSTISSIDKYYYGQPAATAERGVVDNSYSIAINIFFKSKEDHDIYQVDPIHLAFIEKCKHLWEKVVVYDNVLR